MKAIITVVILWILLLNSALAQSLTLSYGPAYTTTKRVVPVANGRNGKGYGNATYVFSLSYEHFLPKQAISFKLAYSTFKGYTQVFYEKGGVLRFGGEIASDGFSGVNISRMDFGLCYTLTNAKKKYYFTPYLLAGLQFSKKTGEEIYSEIAKLEGPFYFELEPISAESFNNVQVVPSIGFRTGFLFWKRIDINLGIQGVLGYKPYQKMYIKYEYKETPQPTAEFEANGTGLFVTLGIGYRIAKLIN